MKTEKTAPNSARTIPFDVTNRFNVLGLVEIEGNAMRPALRNGDLAALVEGETAARPDAPVVVKLTNGKTFAALLFDDDTDPTLYRVHDMRPDANPDPEGTPIKRSDVEAINPIVGVLRPLHPSRRGTDADLGEGYEWVWAADFEHLETHPEADEACRLEIAGELSAIRLPVGIRAIFPRAFGVRITAPKVFPYEVGDVAIFCPDCQPEKADDHRQLLYIETAAGEGDLCYPRLDGSHYIAPHFRGEANARIHRDHVTRTGVPVGILHPVGKSWQWRDVSFYNPDARKRERLTFRQAIAKTGGKVVRLP